MRLISQKPELPAKLALAGNGLSTPENKEMIIDLLKAKVYP